MNTLETVGKSVSQILNEAADLIERTGWCQGHYALTSDGKSVGAKDVGAACFCCIGAIKAVSPTFKDSRDAADVMVAKVGMIHVWNDQPGRTAEEVLESLRDAAKEAAK